MPIYETVLILKPVLSDPEVAELVEKTKKSIGTDGGEILSQEVWGRRKLTHPIGKARDGVYAYFKFKSSTSFLVKFHHGLAISDNVIRHMTEEAQDRKMREKKKTKKAAAPAATPASAAPQPS